jgi:site-specific DNA-cytosine methylase
MILDIAAEAKLTKSRLSCMAAPSALTPSGSSGESAVACIRYVERHRPKMFLLENVKGLSVKKDKVGRSDLQYLQEVFFDMGYLFSCHVVRSQDFGCPQPRERLYMIGLEIGLDVVIPQNITAPWTDEVDSCLVDLKLPAPWPVEDFLLPDDAPEVKRVPVYRLAAMEKAQPVSYVSRPMLTMQIVWHFILAWISTETQAND